MRRLALVIALLAVTAGPAGAATFPSVFPAVSGNPADKLASLAIEGFSYDRATHCVKRPAAGAVALQQWLERNARGSSWGIVRCEMWGKRSASLHAEGRALDWHLDVSRPADSREARRLIGLLLAPDSLGRAAALARRIGVQEIIWDCRAWFGGEPRLGRYSACKGKKVDRTTAHRDHIHFGLTRRGAKKLTSFWTRKPPPEQFADQPEPDDPWEEGVEEDWEDDDREEDETGSDAEEELGR